MAKELPPTQEKSGLPPGVEKDNLGRLIRRVPKTTVDGNTWQQVRPVVLTLAEAKATRKDYYHPDLGWMRYGYKLERDRTPEDIMADGSIGSPNPALIGNSE